MSMILPDDILKEISAFSKPIFRYFREYNAMLRELDKPVWPELKEKLTGTDADKASVLIQQYVNTAETARYLEQTYYKTKQHLTLFFVFASSVCVWCRALNPKRKSSKNTLKRAVSSTR
jgi:hypothetical protein